jgi:hypothetical protein
VEEIHIPMSKGEYCCLSAPAEVMADLGRYIVPDARDPGDPVTVGYQDQSAGPDWFD